MAASRFSLQSVLLLRERERDQARQQMAQAIQVIEQIEQELQTSIDIHSLYSQELNDLLRHNPISIEAVNLRRYHLTRTEIEIQVIKSRLAAGREILEKCRKLLVLADQKVKAIEQIRDRREQEALEEAIKKETFEQQEAWQAGQFSP
ncbi:hypothetical protein Plim_3099 [Planctopirus limnophila DSM 3776]|uniref:Flagellar FliJ protein n=1 Tax=Planctopirus limnophila (strain ATCC 43296 / DSM 3776 / IFAM 1008 / Mu 290) TaxID=521674 RepID=D5SSW3_PLAL2|nr:flagellar export protein FliJ [Planctopirus limnophila]ADG68914.1 hypothetical protein Plim_3099 [Planctopirus limnophila DSM 3776]